MRKQPSIRSLGFEAIFQGFDLACICKLSSGIPTSLELHSRVRIYAEDPLSIFRETSIIIIVLRQNLLAQFINIFLNN